MQRMTHQKYSGIQKGICLLFITAYYSVKNQFPEEIFDFHLTST